MVSRVLLILLISGVQQSGGMAGEKVPMEREVLHIMLFSGAPQALWGGGSCISCFAQGLHRVMGRRVLLILFLRFQQSGGMAGGSHFRGGGRGSLGQSQRAMDVTPQVVSLNSGEKVTESQCQLPIKPTFHQCS